MGRRFFRRFTAGSESVRNHRWLNRLAPGLKHPSLWHLNRRSVSRAAAIGLFWALIPMPWQMVPAAISAVCFRANAGLAVALVWVSNPLTWGPIWYGTYRLGRWILGHEPLQTEETGWRSLVQHSSTIWQPLYLGSILTGLLLAVIGYSMARVLWRTDLVSRWNLRRRRLAALGLTLPATLVRRPPSR
jgi:hypothetical protein